MKKINKYIIEKLKINKKSDPYETMDEENFLKVLNRCGEISFEDIFDENSKVYWPWTQTGHSINSIYAIGKKLIAVWHDSIKHTDIEEEIKYDDFADDQKKAIYDYMLQF